jgi:arylsulfatase A-like enzyme
LSYRYSGKPNLVFILTDQQRSDFLGVSGNSFAQTPHIDNLAVHSTLFKNAYCTQPICTPSRASLLTGLYPHATSCTVNNVQLNDEIRTLPEMLPPNGWKTAYFGKWHLGDEIFAQRGFHHWISTEDQYWKYYGSSRNKDAKSTYHNFLVENHGLSPEDGSRFSRTRVAELPKECSKIDYLTSQAERFISENAKDPFILYVGYLEPHPPYTGPYNRFRSGIEVPLPKNFNDPNKVKGHPKNELQAKYYRYYGGEGAEDLDLNTIKGWEDLIRRYHGMCHHVDQGVGRIVSALEKAGIYDNTLIIYTSDHGDQMGSHGILEKGVMFEESLKIPLIIKEPGQKEDNVISGAVSQIDLVPTILENLGQKIPDSLHGKVLPQSDKAVNSQPVIIEWNEQTGLENDPWVNRCVEAVKDVAGPDDVRKVWSDQIRTIIHLDGWKFSWSLNGWDELFNLNEDPSELDNQVEHDHVSRIIAESKKAIHHWQIETGDPSIHLFHDHSN